MVIRFLIANAYSIGGTIRTTFMTAGQLARDHEVEIVSAYRFADAPGLELDPRVIGVGGGVDRPRVLCDGAPVLVVDLGVDPEEVVHPGLLGG